MRKVFLYPLVLIVFLFLAFTPQTPLFAQDDSEDVMDMELEDLLNVEITTAGKKAEKIGEIPASVVLITRDDIERYGYQSLEEVLENVAGVYKIDDMANYGAAFGMRGFLSPAPRNTVVMVNGVHQMDGFWKTSQTENFRIPVEAIDRIEVIRGPMSVVYGSGAFFGAINIITNMVEENQKSNIVSISGGSMSTVRAAVRLAGNTGEMSYVFNAGYYDTEGPDEPLSKMTAFEPDWAGITSANNTTEKRLEESNKYFNFTADYKGFYSKLSHSESSKDNYVVVPSVSDGSDTIISLTTASFGYRNDISKNFNLDASVTYHKHSWMVAFDFFDPSMYGLEFAKSEEFEFDLTTIFTLSEKFSLTTGMHYQHIAAYDSYDYVPAFPYNVYYTLPDSIKTPSFFAQADFYLSKKLRFVAGIRFEKMLEFSLEGYDLSPDGVKTDIGHGKYEGDKIEAIPRLAMVFSVNDKNFIKLMYGKAIRHPEFQPILENITYGIPVVNPEFIDTFELNYMASPSPKFTLNFSVFYNKLKNLIVRTLGFDASGTFGSYYSNGGELETIGTELSIVARPFEGFLLDVSGTYQKTEDKREGFEDIDVAYSPDLTANIKASYQFGKNVTLAVIARYVDEMEPLWDVAADGRIGDKVDSHFSMDANFRINNLFGKNFYLNFRCVNVFDTDYIYPTNINTNLWAEKGVIGRGLGRTFMVSLGKKF